MLKRTLSFNQNTEAKKCLITKDDDSHVLLNTNAVKKYFVEKKNSISRKPEKPA